MLGPARLQLESNLEYIIPKYESLFIDVFLAYLAEIVESHFMNNWSECYC